MNEVKTDMELLEENIGKTVTIEYVWLGKSREDAGVLKTVRPFREIGLDQKTGGKVPLTTYISFIGTSRAIIKITRDDGEIIYENELIAPDHKTNLQGVYNLMVSTFGKDVAEPYRPKTKIAAL